MDFFLVGAPKTGTTALARQFSDKPDVDFCTYKEPNFFSEDIVGNDRYVTCLEDYERLFSNNGKIRGEASTTYLYSNLAIDSILKLNPKAKFIIGIREYCSFVESQFNQMLKVGFESNANFKEAWSLQKSRSQGKCIPTGCTIPFDLQYKKVISQGHYIQRLKDRVDDKNIYIFEHEHLKNNFSEVYIDILNFLGLKSDQSIVVQNVNESSAPRSLIIMQLLQRLTVLRKALGLKSFYGFGKLLRRYNLSKNAVIKLTESDKKVIKDEMMNDYILLSKTVGRDLKWL